ncbi:protein-tyrosine phosphatase family protein [Methanocaldococcus sp. 28A]
MVKCRHNGEVCIFGLRPASFPNFPFHLLDRIGGFVILDELWLKSWYEIMEYPIKIQTLYVPIEDYSIPTVEDMDLIVDFIKFHVSKNKEVVVSCIGGHGRTGTILAVWAGLNGVKNPIKYVREHYCQYAVETEEQEEFVKHYLSIRKKKYMV